MFLFERDTFYCITFQYVCYGLTIMYEHGTRTLKRWISCLESSFDVKVCSHSSMFAAFPLYKAAYTLGEPSV
jgi:hypothetical protein